MIVSLHSLQTPVCASPHSTSQFRPATAQVLSGHVRLVAAAPDGAGLVQSPGLREVKCDHFTRDGQCGRAQPGDFSQGPHGNTWRRF